MSWKRAEYDKPEFQSPLGRHMAGQLAILNQIPLSEGGFKEPDPGMGIIGTLIASALGAYTGNPLIGAWAGSTFGNTTGNITGALSGAFSGALSGAGGWSGLAERAGISNPLRGAFGSSLGGSLGTPLNSINQFFPADIAARAAAGAGGGMSAFSSILNGVGNFLGSDLGGNLIGAGLNYFGSRQGMNQLNSAADRAFQNAQFQPYNVSGPLGGVAFNGNRINASLSPEGRRVANQLRGLVNTNLRGYNEFNPNNYAQNYYDTVSGLQAPELTAQTNSALSDIYNRGMWGSTEGARNIYNIDQSRMLSDNALRLQAQQAGATESDRLFNNYMKSVATYNTQLGLPMGYIASGLNAGANAANAGANANQYPWLAAQNQADASSAFWSSIASAAPSMMANLFNRGSGSQERNQYNYSRGFYNPSGLGLV